jgi:hypothetical protein
MTEPIPDTVREWWLAESDRRDRELAGRLNAWREGYAAGDAAREDDYERGVHDGIIGYKKATKDLVEMARLQVARYGPGSRQVTDPSLDDFPMLAAGTGGGQ